MRKLSIVYAIICLAMIIVSCQKSVFPNNGKGMIEGHAFYIDSSTSYVSSALKNRTIYICTNADTSAVFYSTNTDSTGFFSIPYLNANQYTIFARYFNGKKIFFGELPIPLKNNGQIANVTLNLYSTLNGSGVLQGHAFYVDSAVSATAKTLKNRIIYIAAGTNIYSTNTDSTGYFIISYLPIGSYKIYASYNNSSIVYSADTLRQSITAKNQNFVLNLYLVPNKAGSEMQGHAYYLDTTMSQLKKLKNQIIYIKDSTSSITYIYSTTTDTTGYFSILNLPVGKYYTIFSSYNLGARFFSGSFKDSIPSNNMNIILPNLYLNP